MDVCVGSLATVANVNAIRGLQNSTNMFRDDQHGPTPDVSLLFVYYNTHVEASGEAATL